MTPAETEDGEAPLAISLAANPIAIGAMSG